MKFLADENFQGILLRSLLLHIPNIDIVRVQDIGLIGADDPAVLDWADKNGAIVLTHDHRTMPTYAYQRLGNGRTIAGMFVMKSTIPASTLIANIQLVIECSTAEDWINQVQDLPF